MAKAARLAQATTLPLSKKCLSRVTRWREAPGTARESAGRITALLQSEARAQGRASGQVSPCSWCSPASSVHWEAHFWVCLVTHYLSVPHRDGDSNRPTTMGCVTSDSCSAHSPVLQGGHLPLHTSGPGTRKPFIIARWHLNPFSRCETGCERLMTPCCHDIARHRKRSAVSPFACKPSARIFRTDPQQLTLLFALEKHLTRPRSSATLPVLIDLFIFSTELGFRKHGAANRPAQAPESGV